MRYKRQMPKVVDPQARRQELAEAVWRIIRRDGLASASVRNVAREAGLSMGSLRHYFATQSELLAFSLRLVSDRMAGRMTELDPATDPDQFRGQLVDMVLPLDEERRAEVEIWLVFLGAALTDPTLRQLSDQTHDRAHQLVRDGLGAMAETGIVHPDRDLDYEAARLHALLDGLVLLGTARSGLMPPNRIRTVLLRHLEELALP